MRPVFTPVDFNVSDVKCVLTNLESLANWFFRFIVIVFSIYAIGDCIHGPMLAHKAEDEGEH